MKKKLGIRAEVVKERREELQKIIVEDNKQQTLMTLKTKEVFESLNEIANSLKNTDKLFLSANKNIKSLLKNINKRLTSLERKVGKYNETDLNNIQENERENIHYLLSLIRAYITDFGAININISKYFRNIDNEIQRIDTIAGYVINTFTDKDVVDTIGGVKVIVDDLYSCHEKDEKNLMINSGGGCIDRTPRIYSKSSDMHYKFRKEGFNVADDKQNQTTITITKGVWCLTKEGKNSEYYKDIPNDLYKDIPQSLQNKWYLQIIGHEYAHHYANKFFEDFNSLEPDMKSDNPMSSNKVGNEILSDRIGNSIAGLTKEEYAKLTHWISVKEYSRIKDVYKAHLQSIGEVDNNIDLNFIDPRSLGSRIGNL
jgi:hypothetical protein